MRLLIASLHLVIAATTLVGAVLWSLQMRVNLAWEMGLYGVPSIVTGAGVAAMGIAFVLSGVQGAAAIGWMFGRIPAGYVLLGLSVFYVCVTAAPLRWLLIASAVGIAMELWARGRPPKPPVAAVPAA